MTYFSFWNSSLIKIKLNVQLYSFYYISQLNDTWNFHTNSIYFNSTVIEFYIFIKGRRFAEQEMYVLLGRMLQNFKIEWHGEDMTQKYQVLMVPAKPATFTFIDRW